MDVWVRAAGAILGLVTVVACGGGGSGAGAAGAPAAPAARSFVIEVSIEGLHDLENVVLRLNGGTRLSIGGGATGGTFANTVPEGAAYNVIVETSSPSATCDVRDSSGVATGDAKVVVICDDPPYPFRQVADVNQVAIDNDSDPEWFTPFGNRITFAASVGTDTSRMYVTDGTPAGTRQATPDLVDFQANLAELNGRMLFNVRTGPWSYSVWSTDGTLSGARPVADVTAAPFTSIGSKAFFFGGKASYGRDAEPWVTDGTAAGTRRLRDIAPGDTASAEIGERIYALGGHAVFRAFDGTSWRLWRSDGTAAGTLPITTEFTRLDIIGVHNGRLYYLRPEPNNHFANEVWSTDGTSGGDVFFINLIPNSDERIDEFVSIGSTLYMATPWGSSPARVWVSDGTSANTRVILEASACGFTEFDGAVYFARRLPGYVASLWRTDGTVGGTAEVIADAAIDVLASCTLFKVGNHLIFPRTTPDAGKELWRSDGATTVERVADIHPGSGSAFESARAVTGATLGGRLYFRASDGTTGMEPWVTDGTTSGTLQLSNIRPEVQTQDGVRSILGYTTAGVFFSGCTMRDDCALWLTDGTPLGTRMVLDRAPSRSGASPGRAAVVGDRLLFAAAPDEMWVSDGSTAGTSQIASFAPRHFYDAGGYRLVSEYAGNAWATDGTVQGTVQLTSDLIAVDGSAALDGRSYFRGLPLQSLEPGLYRTDGTAAGTQRMTGVDITVREAQMFAAINGRLIFTAHDDVHGMELWRSDGTEAGTRLLADLNPGSGNAAPQGFSEFNGEVFFVAQAEDGDMSLWATDGSNVRLVKSFTIFGPPELLPTSNGLYFTAENGLWLTDGTTAGTRALDVRPGKAVVAPQMLTETPGGVFFIAYDGNSYNRPFLVNGEVVTRVSSEAFINAEPPVVVPSGPHAGIYVVGSDNSTGSELWVLEQ